MKAALVPGFASRLVECIPSDGTLAAMGEDAIDVRDAGPMFQQLVSGQRQIGG